MKKSNLKTGITHNAKLLISLKHKFNQISLFSFPGKKAITISRFIDNVETAKSGVHIQDIRSNKECELIQHKWCLRLLACVDFFFHQVSRMKKKIC